MNGRLRNTEKMLLSMKKRKNKTNLSKEILANILDSTVEFCELFWNARRYQKAMATGGREYVAAIKHAEERKRIQTAIAQLKKEKFIEKKRISGKLFINLTNKGLIAAIRHKTTNDKKPPINEYCVVVFDIPESERKIRNFFRSFLKESGFKQLQQSVWYTKKDVSEDIIRLVRAADAEKWVRVIKAKSISGFA